MMILLVFRSLIFFTAGLHVDHDTSYSYFTSTCSTSFAIVHNTWDFHKINISNPPSTSLHSSKKACAPLQSVDGMDQLPPAPLHHRTHPSSPPLTNAPAEPLDDTCGRHDTLHTSPVSWIVETAARAAKSHTFIVLSADPDKASRPSGDMSVLRTQEECPEKDATAPEPGLPEAEVRTSCRIRRLSSDAERRS